MTLTPFASLKKSIRQLFIGPLMSDISPTSKEINFKKIDSNHKTM